MKEDLYKKVETFVIDAFTRANKQNQIIHLKRTVYWIQKLKPTKDISLSIAAIAHDIERAFRKKDLKEKSTTKGYTNPEFFKIHEQRGAHIIAEFLKKEKAPENIIEKVKSLVEKHEEGGDEDQNLLKDADSISFFENNIELFLDEQMKKIGKTNVEEKFNWMCNRITSQKAKEIARPFYEDAMKKLKEI